MKFLEAKRLKRTEGENKALGGPPEDKGRGVSSGSSTSTAGPQASPQARQLATEHGIDLANVKGTGSGGMITAGDVRQAIEAKDRQD